VPLFQEQGMKVAMTMGDFSASEADQLRRAMGHRRARPAMESLCKELFVRMQNKGVSESIANRILKQLNGFSEYGFPESHAIAFGNLVYASAYVKCHFLPEFYVALLNCQPMGFYSPASIVEDAKRHSLPIFMPDVRQSSWDCTVESGGIRMGLRYIKGLGTAAKQALEPILNLPKDTRPATLARFFSRVTLDENEWRSLARAGALDAFWPGEMSAQARKKAIWQAMRLARAKAGPLTAMPEETQIPLFSALSEHELMVTDWVQVGVSSRDHPMAFLRSSLDAQGVLSARALYESRQKRVRVAGLVTVRQMPMTANGFLFITLEDEGGMSNIVVRPAVLESNRALWLEPNALTVEGILQRKGKLVTVLAQTAKPLSLDDFRHSVSRDFH
jgi:error-prone DNA polymerase